MQRLPISFPQPSLQIKILYCSLVILCVWLVGLHCYLFHNDDIASTAFAKMIIEKHNVLWYGDEQETDLLNHIIFNVSEKYETLLTPGAFIHVGKVSVVNVYIQYSEILQSCV